MTLSLSAERKAKDVIVALLWSRSTNIWAKWPPCCAPLSASRSRCAAPCRSTRNGDALLLYAHDAHKVSENQRAHVLALGAATHSSDDVVDAADRAQTGLVVHGSLRAIAERGEALSTESEHALIGFYGAVATWSARKGCTAASSARATQQPCVGGGDYNSLASQRARFAGAVTL